MAEYVIEAENLGKRYRIGVDRGSDDTLASVVTGWLKSPLVNLRRLRRLSRFEGEEEYADDVIWALKDFSFRVECGEVVGLIGRNGAGKSTLLKILASITEPTHGRAVLRGRVASLLEVGTGFHPELTGRENVYLNGAILGMTRDEIDAKYDEIVQFSGVSRFMETPLKRYSSGMKVRLAFSVAAHLDPEILLIDEVLAVGDAEFQRKCLGKMDEVARSGRTVLFVSHNMASIQNLCGSCIYIDDGRLIFYGETSEAIRAYLQGTSEEGEFSSQRSSRRGTKAIEIASVDLKNALGESVSMVTAGEEVEFHVRFEVNDPEVALDARRIFVGIGVRTQFGVPVFLQHNRMTGDIFDSLPNQGTFVLRIPRLPLPATQYVITCSLIYDGNTYLDLLDPAGSFQVIVGDFFGSGEIPPPTSGVCLVEGRWTLRKGE